MSIFASIQESVTESRVLSGTRTLVFVVLDNLAEGMSPDAIAMAKDTIGCHINGLLEDREPIPEE